ncbi:unnamed protein product [Eruca vesicaria subsp. sativa]|uniref:Uncharacterized protein n=1 Tax=Eruca vesicaria subsp. sativa TaxID=29727 RepID=A0ABC8LQW7_ERUVS|nr:unnamed protein product [Eruca vesicaria subsp. sativa]
MVDDRTYLSSQEDSSESKLKNGKSTLDDDAADDEELRQSKSLKLTRLSIQENDSDQQQENGDGYSLINAIGRDLSISCLLRFSLSDYRLVASLNKSFRSLVKSGDIYGLRRQNMIVEHWFYFSYQLLKWVAFDPVEVRWMNFPNIPSDDRTFKSADKESLAVGTDLLVLGKGAPPLVAVVNNELYAADHAGMVVRKYDKESKKWFTLGRLPERADSVNGWGLAFRACGERLIVIGGPNNSGGGFIELNSWIPSNDRSPPVWTLLGRKHSANFVFNCAVMGC